MSTIAQLSPNRITARPVDVNPIAQVCWQYSAAYWQITVQDSEKTGS